MPLYVLTDIEPTYKAAAYVIFIYIYSIFIMSFDEINFKLPYPSSKNTEGVRLKILLGGFET